MMHQPRNIAKKTNGILSQFRCLYWHFYGLWFCPLSSGVQYRMRQETKWNCLPFQMFVLAFLWPLVGFAFAPFPPEHQYNFLNPAIDPWWVHRRQFFLIQNNLKLEATYISCKFFVRWHKLDKSTQTAVYSVWEAKEPYLVVCDLFSFSFSTSCPAWEDSF